MLAALTNDPTYNPGSIDGKFFKNKEASHCHITTLLVAKLTQTIYSNTMFLEART